MILSTIIRKVRMPSIFLVLLHLVCVRDDLALGSSQIALNMYNLGFKWPDYVDI